MESTELQTVVHHYGLDQTKAQIILERFSSYFALAAEWEARAKTIHVTAEDQTDSMALARTGRLILREKRLNIERTRKDLKEQSLREGKAIDGVANVLKGLIEPIETYLEAQEKYVENLVKERMRIAEETKMAAAEQERLAQERAERETRERLQAENQKLMEDAAKRDKEIREERAERERQQREAAEKRHKEIRAEQAKHEQEQREADAKLKAAQDKARRDAEATARANAELEAQRQAEAKKVTEKLAAEKKKREKAERALAGFLTCPSCGHEFKLEK